MAAALRQKSPHPSLSLSEVVEGPPAEVPDCVKTLFFDISALSLIDFMRPFFQKVAFHTV
jgi:hypothetical protein